MPSPIFPSEATEQEPLTRGHKKRERTRRGLVDAALRLVARKEVGEIALLDVAAEAAVDRKSVV